MRRRWIKFSLLAFGEVAGAKARKKIKHHYYFNSTSGLKVQQRERWKKSRLRNDKGQKYLLRLLLYCRKQKKKRLRNFCFHSVCGANAQSLLCCCRFFVFARSLDDGGWWQVESQKNRGPKEKREKRRWFRNTEDSCFPCDLSRLSHAHTPHGPV